MAHNHLEPVGKTNGHGYQKLNFPLMILIAFHFHVCNLGDTLPETNIAPENRPLEKEILIGNYHFQVLC